MVVSWAAPGSEGSKEWKMELKVAQPSELRSWEARTRPVQGSAEGGGVISLTVWPASVNAATVVLMAREMAGVGGTTPMVVQFVLEIRFLCVYALLYGVGSYRQISSIQRGASSLSPPPPGPPATRWGGQYNRTSRAAYQ